MDPLLHSHVLYSKQTQHLIRWTQGILIKKIVIFVIFIIWSINTMFHKPKITKNLLEIDPIQGIPKLVPNLLSAQLAPNQPSNQIFISFYNAPSHQLAQLQNDWIWRVDCYESHFLWWAGKIIGYEEWTVTRIFSCDVIILNDSHPFITYARRYICFQY